jgi:acid phosphatase type 7
MKLKGRKSILAAVLAVCFFIVPGSIFAGAYDGTKINADLNAFNKPDHITLTWTDNPATTMTITWRTDSSVKTCKVEYGSMGKDTDKLSLISPVQPTVFKTSAADSVSGKMHIFITTLTGLKPGAHYIYRIGNDKNEWTDFHRFTTESENEKSANAFKFLLFGDSQSGKGEVPRYDNWHATLHNAYNANRDAKFFINVGDLVEIGQYYQHWNNWFKAAEGVIDTIPALVVEGNHETYIGTDRRSTRPEYFLNQFNLFRNGPIDLKGLVYSYDYGKCHFAVLDSQAYEESEDATGRADPVKEEALLKEQAAWLDKDLAAHKDAVFTFVLFHKTPYSNKVNRENTLLKKVFCPVLDTHHVDVVFNGHDHASSRTYPIYRDEIMRNPSEGTVYYVTGRSGEKYYSDLTRKVWNAAFFDPQDQPDYQTVELDGRELTIKYFKQDGTLIDTYIIDKDHPEKNTSAGELPPPKLTSVKDNPVIGTDLKIVVFGNYTDGNSGTEEEMNGKIDADKLSIASHTEGSYDAVAHILTINEKKYQCKDDVLMMAKAVRSPSTLLSIMASPADTMRSLIWFLSKDKFLQACL